MVTPKGNAKVLDFGLARWTAGDPTVYSAPEEVPGRPVDYRTDIFSIGVVLFEMLTGRLPFDTPPSGDASQSAPAIAPVPSSVNRSLPPELDPIVARALANTVEDRYASAATMAAELRAVGAILDVRSDAQEAAAPFVAVPNAARRPAAGSSSCCCSPLSRRWPIRFHSGVGRTCVPPLRAGRTAALHRAREANLAQ